jgi:hypothetical protein
LIDIFLSFIFEIMNFFLSSICYLCISFLGSNIHIMPISILYMTNSDSIILEIIQLYNIKIQVRNTSRIRLEYIYIFSFVFENYQIDK